MEGIKQIAISLRMMNWKFKILGLLLTLIFIFFVYIALAPLNKMKEFENLVNSDSLFMEKYDDIYNHSELRPLIKERIFKEALLKLAKSDSIQLVINLSDSSVNLTIKGVMIHRTKVSSFSRDRIFKTMPVIQEVGIFSEPLPVYAQYGTIVKEPVVIRHAPKDTLEAALNAWQPDTLIQNPAFVMLSMHHGINLIFEQEDNPGFKDKWKKFSFYNRLMIKNFNRYARNFVNLNKQDYHPVIRIKMPVHDLRAIYRALPDHTLVVINI